MIQRTHQFLTRKEAAQAIGVCERSIDNWIIDDGLPHYKLGRKLFISRPDLIAWVEAHRKVKFKSPNEQ